MTIRVQDLMEQSGVTFGTSGARGLAADMTDRVCYIYTRGFLQYLESIEDTAPGSSVAVAGDLRPSTDRIMGAVEKAILDAGYKVIDCGKIPSPAVALLGIERAIPSIMVTGSHIPADRNGIKFNKSAGEILKNDEEGIRHQVVQANDALFAGSGMFADGPVTRSESDSAAKDAYIKRYLSFFPSGCLQGVQMGVYLHSAVGGDIMVEIYRGLGAQVHELGRASEFIPVDTEAIRPEDVALAENWAKELDLMTIVSTDGDSDRPLISDENGVWLRGDVAGILAARYLEADSVSTPVSCNSAVEKCGAFLTVRRTRIGSPFVIASMNDASAAGAKMVVGYEANGGFLTNSDFTMNERTLRALPTRDAVILHLAIVLLARQRGCSISQLVSELPSRFTASDRLKEFPQQQSQAILSRFTTGRDLDDKAAIEEVFGDLCKEVDSIDRTDGVRITFVNQEVVHLRPSGNAPEFRCYTEADTEERAVALNNACMDRLRNL